MRRRVGTASSRANSRLFDREIKFLLKGFLALLLDPTTGLIVIALTPALAQTFGVGLNEASWWITGYLVVYVAAMPVAGGLGDTYGSDRVLQAGLIGFVFGTLVCIASTTFLAFLVGRLLQGLAAAFLLPMVLTQVSWMPEGHQGRTLGLFELAGGLSGLGAFLAGVLATLWGWRTVLVVPLWIAVGAGIMTSKLGRPSYSPPYDAVAPRAPHRQVIAALRILRRPLFRWSVLSASGIAFVMTCKTLLLPVYLSHVWSFSPERLIMLILLNPLGMTIGNLSAGQFLRRLSPVSTAAIGTGIFAVALAILIYGIWWQLLGLALAGFTLGSFGGGFASVGIVSAAVRSLPITEAGASSGIFGFVRRSGTLIGSAVTLPLLEFRLRMVDVLSRGFIDVVVVLVGVVVLLLALALATSRQASVPDPARA